ncbi:DUF2339 domain-containing protein [Verrucomicrobiaceae bacterium N1E253]|uniref:DUF2339 domain-containing protein n=1 Tax=Oceaniferula marina TaxID=2748318 RepID=A0A851GM62_9BACT|nr:DUF2339 domain-containing protein [Oceaniferula marina]NWK55890.1 DUF2339 domain-containing protein [Oceaniferula marina]
MDRHVSSQIEALRQQQERIRETLQGLEKQCQQVDRDLDQLTVRTSESSSEAFPTTDKPASDETKQPANPAPSHPLQQAIAQDKQQVESATPPPLPAAVKTAVKTAVKASKASGLETPVTSTNPTAAVESTKGDSNPRDPGKDKPAKPASPSHQSKPSPTLGEWELNFGKIWLVRLGVVFLLTGLIFLSTYAYRNWLFHSGPAVKVAFFMLISISLTGVGLWLERWKDRFKHYGRVLASGGLAAGYYTLYAAHFTPALKIIDSPVLAATLLTLWAGIMLAFAVWKQSRIIAVMAIGLAFYGTIVNPAGTLSLFSSLLLASAGVWLMLRFRWVAIGLGTTLAAYAAHAFWLGYYPGQIAEPVRLTYLASYWLLFSFSLLTPQAKRLDHAVQRAMAAINNTSAWGLTVFLIPSFTAHPQIGWISIGIGVLWLGMAAAIRWLPGDRAWHRSLAVIYGYQGALIASLGILLEATGYTRFLIFAVEACILLAGARQFGGTLARLASTLAIVVSVLAALPEANGLKMASWPSYAALALVYAVYTAIVRWDCGKNRQNIGVAMIPAGLVWLVLAFGVFNQWSAVLGLHGLFLTSAATLCAYLFTKKPWWFADLALISFLPCLGAVWWFFYESQNIGIPSSVTPVATVILFWFLIPRHLKAWDELMDHREASSSMSLEWVFSILATLMTAVTLSDPSFPDSLWLVAGGLLALSAHAVSHFTQRRSFGVPALLFHAIAWVHLLAEGRQFPLLGWMPMVLALVQLAAVDTISPILGKRRLRMMLALMVLASGGVHAYQELARPDLMLTVIGIGMISWAYARNSRGFASACGTPALILACVVSLLSHPVDDWARYLPMLATIGVHALLWRRRPSTDSNDPWLPTRSLILGASLLSLFFATSIHVRSSFEGSGLSICWALLAISLFCLGLLMRCRPYRLIGLAWLALAAIHVVSVDVMRLGTLGRILSFIILGVVLLLLGFLYNRFQETIRKFL